jgi:hypothetical protein
MEISKLGVLKKLEAIEEWQKNPLFHSLTCGNCTDVKLEGIAVETDFVIKVILKCPNCDYTQDFVPEYVYKWYVDLYIAKK